MKWREAIEYGNYDPQCDTITWCNHTEKVSARFSKAAPSQLVPKQTWFLEDIVL